VLPIAAGPAVGSGAGVAAAGAELRGPPPLPNSSTAAAPTSESAASSVIRRRQYIA
jgi:hypothetical protein